ncbi:MAG: L,D-transpeptidase family protein [Acidobacteriia bacterium]|nr:L,D-transpeptidase family protein [Methyloceanibacter sp.]MCL6491699.1 L,D-transpeptidase family protein [Terriglobia bacterium]
MRAVVSPQGHFFIGNRIYRAALGRGGVRTDKREGDGVTPAGVLPLRRVLFRADRIGKPPRCALPREPISPDDGWCDDPLHPDYNRMVRLPHPARCEALWRSDSLYDVVSVLGWNDAPPVPGRGSAIFLHVATPDLSPTAGCIALPLGDLLAVLAAGLTEIEVAAE